MKSSQTFYESKAFATNENSEVFAERESEVAPNVHIKAYGIADGIRNVRVNKDKLEDILSSQKSMQNYEDALWSFEKSLNNEIKENRINLVQEMQKIQQKHEDSRALKETSKSLKYLDDGISHR